ncbi:hypothetical protein MHYP_G00015980 [Metynnis hypsauchen]
MYMPSHSKSSLKHIYKRQSSGNISDSSPPNVKKLPKNPERFNRCDCVLGKEGFSSGRFYYEVQVSGKTEWDLGVTTESSNRKSNITLSPEDGYWTVSLTDETEYEALDSPPVPLSLKQAPQKVGVFVDYEEGLVSFYDVEARSHIYSFTVTAAGLDIQLEASPDVLRGTTTTAVMASSSSLLSEDQLLCSICLDVFTDPVSTPCGHNFCRVCLKECWDSSSRCQCPVCKEEFFRRPELRVNTFISGLAAQFKKSVQTQLVKTQADIQQMIQDRLKKIEEIRRSVKLSKKSSEEEKADSVEVFRALLRCIERSQAELLEVMEEKQKAAERQAEEFIKELEQEITELKRRDTELEQLSHTEDHLHLLQVYPSLCSPPHTKNWTDVRISTPLRAETLRRALTRLQEELSKEMEKVDESELKRIQRYSVDVTLDPDTANPFLILSDDGKQVTDGDKRQNLPDTPERFDRNLSVLGKEGFSSGRFYYEVQVSGKTEWRFGVTTESSNRKGKNTRRPEDGYWTVWLNEESEYEALDSRPVPLSLKQAPQKVGVFVDYEEGLVSFYDVDFRSHIYSFTGQSFSEKIYPVLNPCTNNGGTNSAPLIITPVDHDK